MKESALCPVFTVEGGGPEAVFSPRILLGRGPACHLRFREDKVSVVHAEVVLTDKGYLLRDLDSTNGVYVNGKRVQEILLKSGDRFRLGREGPLVLFQLEPSDRGYRPRPVERPGRFRRNRSLLLGLLIVLLFLGVGLPGILSHRRQSEALRSAFLLGTLQGETVEPLGSAFLVHQEGWLLTNAHVALALRGNQDQAVASPNISPQRRCRVLNVLVHPDYKEGEFRWDVALVRVDIREMEPSLVRWSRKMPRQGQPVFCIGYPSHAVHPSRPTASLLQGVISRVEGECFFQHDVEVRPGLSGSPLFDEGFNCIGICLGGDGAVGWALTAESLRSFCLSAARRGGRPATLADEEPQTPRN